MQRRQFISKLWVFPLAGYAGRVFADCVDEEFDNALNTLDDKAIESLQSFGYYQGLLPSETRDPGRTDGTASSMPCITAEDIVRGIEKEYTFWHGHGAQNHRFTVTAEHFTSLQAGHDVEILTSVVDGHRHALLISPARRCQA